MAKRILDRTQDSFLLLICSRQGRVLQKASDAARIITGSSIIPRITHSNKRHISNSYISAGSTSTGVRSFSSSSATNNIPVGGDVPSSSSSSNYRPDVFMKSQAIRDRVFNQGYYWVYDDEVANISELSKLPAGTLVNLRFDLPEAYRGDDFCHGGDKNTNSTNSANNDLALLGILNRQASVTVRVIRDCNIDNTSNSMTSIAAYDITSSEDNYALSNKFKAKLTAIFNKRCFPRNDIQSIDDILGGTVMSESANPITTKNNDANSHLSHLYGRILHAEADGFPGVFVDRFGPGAAIITYLSIGSYNLFHELIEERLTKHVGVKNIGVHKMVAKKEKFASTQEGGDHDVFVTTLVKGRDSSFFVRETIDSDSSKGSTSNSNMVNSNTLSNNSNDGIINIDGNMDDTNYSNDSNMLEYELNLYAASSVSSGGSSSGGGSGLYNCVISGGAGWNYGYKNLRDFVGNLVSSSSRSSPGNTNNAAGATVLDCWSMVGGFGIRCAKMGASEVVLIEDSVNLSTLCEKNIVRNGVESNTTAIHRVDVKSELRNMALSGLQFNIVVVNLQVVFDRYYKQKRGQFGKWHKPDLKGIEQVIRAAGMVVQKDGYLVVTNMLLSDENRSWGTNLIRYGLDQADRTASIVFEEHGCNTAAYPRSMEDYWYPRCYVLRLH